MSLASTSSFSQTISTIAGTGTSGFSGDGGLATAAELNTPTSTAIDAAGNLYQVELLNHRVRKIDATTGVITTIAGTGTPGFSGDGGLASVAQLNHPIAIALDAAENIYIVDAFNHRIRRISAITGNITTVVGTGAPGSSGDGALATIAKLYIPAGIVFDAAGDYYIISQGNHKVRKVTFGTGIISTIAGTGTAGFSGDGGLATAAEFDSPAGITIDATGNLYVADNSNHRIRKIDNSTGNISTIAGIGSAGFSGDGSLATAAELNNPIGITLDAAGNFYIADNSNHRIRMINEATGIISTFAGVGTAGFSGDGGLPTAAELNYPYTIMFDAVGDIYIPDGFNHRIRKVSFCTPNTGTDTRSECNPFVWIDGNTYTSNNNSATFVLQNVGGCDSTVTLDLTITNVDVSVTQNGTDLTANELVASYQWLDCNDNYSALAGETFRTYYGLTDGSYAVEVTYYGCKDTSNCFVVSTSGVQEETENTNITFTGYPNPATDQFTISSTNEEINNLNYQVFDITGKLLLDGEITEKNTSISISNLEKAMYFIKIQRNNTIVETIKMIKN